MTFVFDMFTVNSRFYSIGYEHQEQVAALGQFRLI